jgi:hypothetical protein
MQFSLLQNPPTPVNLQVNGEQFDNVPSLKLIGVNIQNDLSGIYLLTTLSEVLHIGYTFWASLGRIR